MVRKIGIGDTANYEEKRAIDTGLSEYADQAHGRRQSLALNIVQNPLQNKPPDTVVCEAEAYAESHGLSEHADLLGRAALVARGTHNFNDIPRLSDKERHALHCDQGWDQTGANGANLSFPKEIGIDGEGRDEWIVGIINSIIFLTAGLIGAFIVDPLNHYFGRRGEIFITACCLIATPTGSAFANSWEGLFAARFAMGIGIGAKNATVPIYSAEMAPARIRGALVMFWQLWVTVGAFLGFYANVIVKDVGRIAWRLELGSAFIPAFVLAVKKLKEARGAGYFQRLWDCFAVPRIRRANYGASTVMLTQQMCGISIISFYSSTIFRNAGHSQDQALFASLGYGAIQVVFTIPTLFLIDTKGRRFLTLATFPMMCIFLLAGGLSLLIPDTASQGAQIGPVALFIYLFTIMYCLGEGPIAFQYSAEAFPTIQREQGMAWVICINNTFASVLSLTFPRMQTVMSPTGAFGFYAGLILIAWGMIFCFVRETKQMTLEELDRVFSFPIKSFISYEVRVWLPYIIKRYVFRQNIIKPAPIIEKGDTTSIT
ncbi:hypothetical protein NM208_g8095 [Fusarium decemcellulare]|uniref:Uncharacterized protein n=1 Tax=Fusarium decemcellulare TaxID=57161 RepID=A0ACC1S6K3_9HYPO|nr:hypothetical protein NM208_g8095 [Fusarium decemcellulare]